MHSQLYFYRNYLYYLLLFPLSLFWVFCFLLTTQSVAAIVENSQACSLSRSQSNIRCCQGVCWRLFLNKRETTREWGRRSERGEKKGEMGDNCILPQFRWQQLTVFSLCLWVSVHANYQNTPTPWQQHQAASVRLFSEERRREERRGFPLSFPTRHVVLLLSCHEDTPHTSPLLLFTDAQTENPPPAPTPPGLSVTLHHLHVNFSLGCHLPTQSSISLSVCLAGRINGLSLEQVLILLQWTRPGPPDWNTLLHQYHWPISKAHLCFCQFSHDFCLWNPGGWLQCFANEKIPIVLVTSNPIHGKL